MIEKIASVEELEYHRNLFNNWLSTLKRNATVIPKSDLEKIKKYSISQRDGVVASPDITFNLKRRITSNKFVLANFASGTDCVCVLQKTMTVSYHDFLSLHIHNRKTVLPITLLL